MLDGCVVQLNLGSRGTRIPGFLSLDCDRHEGVDMVVSIDDLSGFSDGLVETIYASHCLEHLPHAKTLPCLKEWARVLKPGGILYAAVPDFARAVELYLIGGINQWVQEFVSGGQEYATAYHYAIFDAPKLRGLLLQAGFSEASRVEYFDIAPKDDCSGKVSTFDGKSVSLNMVAIR